MNVCRSPTPESKGFINVESDFLKITTKDIWFPSHISEIDKCQQLSPLNSQDANSIYPGFTDPVYIKRRNAICSIGQSHKIGDVIPRVEYTKEEKETWSLVYTSLRKSHSSFACAEYLRSFKMLEDQGVYSPDAIPQLQDVSSFMAEQTGFQLYPTTGLLTARDFLASLAFKVFQCTQYVRHHSSPMHTPVPDCCHELLGHVPMFCDPNFAIFSQEVGLASLGASDDDIEKLSTLYWFTVEFGLCKEQGDLKAYGAGLLSSFGELEHAVSDVPEHHPLVAAEAAVQAYDDSRYQAIYFVSNSFEEAIQEVRAYSMKGIKRNFYVKYVEEEQKVLKLPKTHHAQ